MPLADMVKNMQGLQAIAINKQAMRDREIEQQQRETGIEALRKYYDSEAAGNPDMGAFYTAVTNVPDAAKNVLNGLGIIDEQRGKDAAQFAIQASRLTENPDQFMQLASNRVAYLQKAGRDPSDTLALIQQYQAGDKKGVLNNLQGVSAALVAAGHMNPKAYEMAYPEAISELDKKKLDLQSRELDLKSRQINQTQAAIGMGTSNQKDWNTYQQLLKTDPEQAAAFGRAAGFSSKEGQQLSSFSEKQVSAASDEYNNANAAVTKYQNLADVIRSKKLGGGLGASWAEAIKEYTGDQNEITQLRKTVSEIVNGEAIKALPPGPATDRDISLVREPFPTAKANGEYIANWLEAVSRLNQKRAEYAEHKAAFIAQNGGQRNKAGETVLSTWKAKQAEQAATQPASSKYKIEVMQ